MTSRRNNSVSLEEYSRHIAAASATGNYFMFRESYIHIMSHDAALVIQKMINKFSYLAERNRLQKGGWFTFTVAQLEKHLLFKKDAQARILRELEGYNTKGEFDEDRQFIEVSRKGVPPKRIVRINHLRLHRALFKLVDSQSSGNPDDRDSQTIDNRDSQTIHTSKEKTRKEHSPRSHDRDRANSDFGLDDKVETKADIIAKQLLALLTKHRRVMRKPKLKQWSKEIVTLLKAFRPAKVIKALKWYDENINEKFTPKLYSAKSFCDDFPRLLDAMSRSDRADTSDDTTEDGTPRTPGVTIKRTKLKDGSIVTRLIGLED